MSVFHLIQKQIERDSGRYAEIYGSPAIAYGRVYFATENGVYCLGDEERGLAALSVTEAPKSVKISSKQT